jgi:flagellar hook protein FlgE
MLGAIFIGLSGLSAYSRGLKTISNNVANLNTPGFKASTVRFSDAYSPASGGARYGGLGSGASGGGVRFSQSSLNFSGGELRATSEDLDLAVNGRGLLVLLDGDNTYYTRTASFKVDENGDIVDVASGHKLAVLDANGTPVAVSVASKLTRQPEATTKVPITGVLSTESDEEKINAITIFDSAGGTHSWNILIKPAATSGEWTVTVTEGSAEVGVFTLKTLGMGADPTSSVFTTSYDPATGPPMSVKLDFSEIDHWNGGEESSLVATAASIDGSAASQLASIKVVDGRLELAYGNDKKEDMGAVALADFLNPQDLDSLGGGLFENSKGLSNRMLGADDKKIGQVVGAKTEASNVDLSQEFGDLILVQRGYQASSQVVSVSNDMIQQLFGIRGQG